MLLSDKFLQNANQIPFMAQIWLIFTLSCRNILFQTQ